MQPRQGTASEFVLSILTKHPDREFRPGDLADLSAGRFSRDNIFASLRLFFADGQVIRNKDGRDAWWAITEAGLQTR